VIFLSAGGSGSCVRFLVDIIASRFYISQKIGSVPGSCREIGKIGTRRQSFRSRLSGVCSRHLGRSWTRKRRSAEFRTRKYSRWNM